MGVPTYPAGPNDDDAHSMVAPQQTKIDRATNRVVLKRQFTAFYSLVVCKFFRQTETP